MCLRGFFFCFHLKLRNESWCSSVANYSHVVFTEIKIVKKAKLMQKYPGFLFKSGSSTKRAEFYISSNSMQLFVHYETKWLLNSHLLQKILLRKPNKPILSIFRALLLYPISELKKERRSGTPVILGLLQATVDGNIRATEEHRPFIWFQQKQRKGRFSTQNQSEVRRLVLLGVNCQVGQHSRLSCSSPGFSAGRGVGAAQPNWLSEICTCI